MDDGHHLDRPNKLYKAQLDNLHFYIEAAHNSLQVSYRYIGKGAVTPDGSMKPLDLTRSLYKGTAGHLRITGEWPINILP